MRGGCRRRTVPTRLRCSRSRTHTGEPDLVPVRHGRMMVSPFTFYRGAAKIMATDLKDTPDGRPRRPALRRRAPVELRRVRLARADAGVRPQRLRRDASRPVRVRREADGGELHDRRPATTASPRPTRARRRSASVTAYREAMARFAQMRTMEIWYARLSEAAMTGRVERPTQAEAAEGATKARKRGKRPGARSRPRSAAEKTVRRRTRATACRRCPSSARSSTASYRIVSQPPIVVPAARAGGHATACPPTRSRP